VTCIVGLVAGGVVHMGGDSACVGGLSLWSRSDAKVFSNGGFLFGFTSSFRMGQLLRYALRPPKRHADEDVMKFMVTELVPAVRQCLKDGGFASRDSERESGGTFLVGYAGRLFRVCDDYQVGECADGYDACGCGEEFARGAMFATKGKPPAERITTALEAAAAHSAGVRAPFVLESI
jgi:hypothetical protein